MYEYQPFNIFKWDNLGCLYNTIIKFKPIIITGYIIPVFYKKHIFHFPHRFLQYPPNCFSSYLYFSKFKQLNLICFTCLFLLASVPSFTGHSIDFKSVAIPCTLRERVLVPYLRGIVSIITNATVFMNANIGFSSPIYGA